MSALDDLRAHATAALESLTEAERLAREADELAGELEERAAGWPGVAHAMSQVREELGKGIPAISAALSTTVATTRELTAISAETSSEEVATRLSSAWDSLDTARRAAAEAGDPFDEVKTLADQAGAHVVAGPADLTCRELTTVDAALNAALTVTESELRAADAWGEPVGGGPGGRPALSTQPPLPPYVRSPGT